MAATSIGCWSKPRRPRRPARHRRRGSATGGRRRSRGRAASRSSAQAVGRARRAGPAACAGGDQRLGQRRVGVASGAARATASAGSGAERSDRVDRVGQQSAGRRGARGWTASTLGGAERGEGHRPRHMRRALPEPRARSTTAALLAHRVVGRAAGRGAERPEAAAPAVLDAAAAVPATAGACAGCASVPVDALGLGEEAAGHVRASSATLAGGAGLADDHDQHAGHVVGAVAVLPPWRRRASACSNVPMRVAHRQDVAPGGRSGAPARAGRGGSGAITPRTAGARGAADRRSASAS